MSGVGEGVSGVIGELVRCELCEHVRNGLDDLVIGVFGDWGRSMRSGWVRSVAGEVVRSGAGDALSGDVMTSRAGEVVMSGAGEVVTSPVVLLSLKTLEMSDCRAEKETNNDLLIKYFGHYYFAIFADCCLLCTLIVERGLVQNATITLIKVLHIRISIYACEEYNNIMLQLSACIVEGIIYRCLC